MLWAEGGKARFQALALYYKAMHFNRVRIYRGQRLAHQSKLDPAVPKLVQRYRDPIPLLRQLIAQFPQDKIIVDARIALGLLHRNHGRYLAARIQFERVIADHPKARWVSDAKHYLQRMRQERVAIVSPGQFAPSEQKQLQIRTRNLADFTVRTYPFDLARLSADGRILNDSRITLG